MPSVEDIVIRVGSYAPRGAGEAYFSGGVRGGQGKAVAGGALSVGQPRDEYIPSNPPPSAESGEADAEDHKDAGEREVAFGELTPEERQVIEELKVTDRKVRVHEQAHIAVGGPYILGGPSFEYESGPDKRRYAVGGEVSIDTSPLSDNPEATIAKMQVVRAAALAPAEPSAQDRSVASSAIREESRARGDLMERKAAESRGEGEAGQTRQSADDAEGPAQRLSRVVADAMSAYAAVRL